MPEPCLDDLECRPNELCYVNTTWFDNNYNVSLFNDTLPGCACNTFYHWKGSNCAELASMTIFYVVVYIMLLLANVFALWHTLGSCRKYFYDAFIQTYNTHFHYLRLCSYIRNQKTYIFSFMFVGVSGTLLWCLEMILSNCSTSGPFLAEKRFLYRDPFKGRFSIIGYWGGGGGTVFLGAACLILILWWSREKHSEDLRWKKLFFRKKLVIFWLIYAIVVSLVVSNIYERLEKRRRANIIGFTATPVLLYILVCTKLVINLKEKKESASIMEDASTIGSKTFLELYTEKDMCVTENTERHANQVDEVDHAQNNNIEEVSSSFARQKTIKNKQILFLNGVLCGVFILWAMLLIWSIYDVSMSLKLGGNGWRESVNPGRKIKWMKVVYLFKIIGSTTLSVSIATYCSNLPGIVGQAVKAASPAGIVAEPRPDV